MGMAHEVAIPQTKDAAFERKEQEFPEVSDSIFNKMLNAPGWESDFNEESIFDKMYDEAFLQYYPEGADVRPEGSAMFHAFQRWKPFVKLFTRHVLRGDVDEPLDADLDYDAEGGGQAVIRPIFRDTWGSTDFSYEHTYGSTGEQDLIPDDAAGNTEQATAKEQAWVIIGYEDSKAGSIVPYHYLQEDVNDDIGARRPVYTKWQMENPQTANFVERRRGPLVVEPSFTLDIDLDIVQTNITTAIRPVGVEIIRADATEYEAVQD